MELREYKVVMWLMLPQLVAALLALSMAGPPQVELSITESVGLSVFYIVLIALMTVLIVVLLKKGFSRLIRVLTGVLLFYGAAVSLWEALSPLGMDLLSIPLAALITLLGMRPGSLGNTARCVLAALLSYLIITIFPWTFITIFLVALSLYDAYSVFKGPLSSLFRLSIEETLQPMFITHGRAAVGLGDLFSYALATSTSLRMIPLPFSLIPVVLLNVGVVITLYLLYSKERPLPGLTIPVLMWASSLILLIQLS